VKRRLAEESVLFASIIKWFVLATIIGGVVGLSTAKSYRGSHRLFADMGIWWPDMIDFLSWRLKAQ